MKNNCAKNNWILDVIIYTGFLVMFFLNLTGVDLHQWLGLAVGILVLYHLLSHWDWVAAIGKRFFGKTSRQARLYFVIDAGLMLGFLVILISGLAISTWFNFSSKSISGWYDLHVIVSIITLLLTFIKIGVHWRWIVRTAQRFIPHSDRASSNNPAFPSNNFLKSPPPLPTRGAPALQPVPVQAKLDRRGFLKLMGISAAATLVALANIGESIQGVLASHDSTPVALTPSETPPVVQETETEPVSVIEEKEISSTNVEVDEADQSVTANTLICTSRCPKGRHCSFPGNCRQYTDSNNNGLCDLGECS